MCYERNIEARSRNRYIFRVFVFVCVYSLIYTACNAHAPYYTYIVICAVSGLNEFSHIISYTAQRTGNVIQYKMCDLIFSTTFVWNIPIPRRIQRNIIILFLGFHVK
jgi:hypothetical protein